MATASPLARTAPAVERQLVRLELVGERVADQLDWRRRPEVAALLTAIRANPPESAIHRNTFATGNDDWLAYKGGKVNALRILYERESHVAMVAHDNGDKRPWRALQNCDPVYRDGPRAVPSYLWLSSPVDRIIYDTIHGDAERGL